jgi:hypothetical protein
MSHLLNSVNNVKSDTNGNIDVGLSSLISSPNDSSIIGIDASGNSKKLSAGTEVGELALSYVVESGGWTGSANITEGYQLLLRGSSCNIVGSSYVTTHLAGGPGWIIGWTVAAGNYVFILNQAIDTNNGSSCNAQVYNATTSSYVGPKVHFETGNFSTTLIYYASVTSSTRFEFRARDVASTPTLFNATSMFACGIQLLKV